MPGKLYWLNNHYHLSLWTEYKKFRRSLLLMVDHILHISITKVIYIFGLIFNTFQPHIHRSGRSHHHRPPSWRCSNCWTQGQTQPLLGCDFLAVNLAWIKELNEDPQQHTQSFGRAMRKEFNYRPSIVITGFNH